MWLAISAINLALAVMIGAFGAHGLHGSIEQLTWWHTATDYFFYHALGLFGLSILAKTTIFPIKIPFLLLQIGIVIFCGSLYLMGLGAPRVLGAIIPIGGLCMILGWLITAYYAIRKGA